MRKKLLLLLTKELKNKRNAFNYKKNQMNQRPAFTPYDPAVIYTPDISDLI